MKAREALQVLAEVMESQWGMVTSAQARVRGVSLMNLTRLTESGDLVRLAHGVYRSASAPSEEHEDLRAAWLAADPQRLAFERIAENPGSVVVSGESAARVHGIGDLRALVSEFTTPMRKQTQRQDVHYRMRVLPDQDVIVRVGLPVTTPERTIVDLVENREDLSLVAAALRDADRQFHLDMSRLEDLLAPLAARNGHRKGDGGALLDELLQIAGIDLDSLAEQVASAPDFGALVTAKFLDGLQNPGRAALLAASATVSDRLGDEFARCAKLVLDRPLSETLGVATGPVLPHMGKVGYAVASTMSKAATNQLRDQVGNIDWAAMSRATRRLRDRDVER